MMLFTSDNWAGVHPKIMDAMIAANIGPVPAYGADELTQSVINQFTEMFGKKVDVAFVATGSAANSIALAAMLPPFGAVFCHEHAHIQIDECGAPEFFTGGAKVLPLAGEGGKLTPAILEEGMRIYTPAMAHRVLPKAVSLTQGTEAGTVYTNVEIRALTAKARELGLYVHMDGARFANAAAHLGASPKEIVTDTGVDILTLGGTKNGCMVAEAIIVLNEALSEHLVWRQKRAGQGFSKNRFLAAQWNAYFEDDLWLKLGAHANAMATRLGEGISAAGFELVNETQINEVFPILPDAVVERLKEKGAAFYDWVQPGDPYDGKLRRLVTSYQTSEQEVGAFLSALKELS
ncbi:low specificity L-threonine aldolase [Parvularcula marina]|uniref:threonine aldolase family protein n=1 Tax=Parvularcula marina TaxID=2292771 RepID=UPI003514E4EF